jgi:hypothetical protein
VARKPSSWERIEGMALLSFGQQRWRSADKRRTYAQSKHS